MGFKSPLDVGRFIGNLEKGHKCKKCGRDNRAGADTSRINVLQTCQECGKPLVWEKTNDNGETQEYEWINGKGIVAKKSRNRTSGHRVRIIDID